MNEVVLHQNKDGYDRLKKFAVNKQVLQENRERYDLLVALEEQYFSGLSLSANAIRRIMDEEIYRAAGFTSFKAYVQERMPFSRSQAFFYLKVARKELPENSMMTKDEFTALGANKVKAVLSLDDEDFSNLFDKGKIVAADGEILEIEDLRDMAASELDDKLRRMRREGARKTEEIKMLKAEAKAKQEFYEKKDKEIEEYRHLKDIYGKKKLDVEDQMQCLTTVSILSHQLYEALARVNITEESSPELMVAMSDRIRSLHAFLNACFNRYTWLVGYVDEFATFCKYQVDMGEGTEMSRRQKKHIDDYFADETDTEE